MDYTTRIPFDDEPLRDLDLGQSASDDELHDDELANLALDLKVEKARPKPAQKIVPAMPTSTFDYAALPKDVAADARQIAERIHIRTHDYAIETGRDLLKIKDRLDHGLFEPWVTAEFDFTVRTAQNYMAAASAVLKYERLASLPLQALYQLGVSTVPDTVLASIAETVGVGGSVPTAADVKGQIAAATGKASRPMPAKAVTATVSKNSIPPAPKPTLTALAPVPGVKAPPPAAPTVVIPTETEGPVLETAAETPAVDKDLKAQPDRMHLAIEKAVSILQRRLGDKFVSFQRLMDNIDLERFVTALRNAEPLPAAATPVITLASNALTPVENAHKAA